MGDIQREGERERGRQSGEMVRERERWGQTEEERGRMRWVQTDIGERRETGKRQREGERKTETDRMGRERDGDRQI